MVGWMITCAAIAVSATFTGTEWQQHSLTSTGAVFAVLLLMFLLTKIVRGRV